MPYEQALSLAEGSDQALLQSLAILDRLGASPLEIIVRKRLRTHRDAASRRRSIQ